MAASVTGLVLVVIGLMTNHAPRISTALAVELGLFAGIAMAYHLKYIMLKHCRELASGVRVQNSVLTGLMPLVAVQACAPLHVPVCITVGMILLPLIIAYPEQKAVWLETERVRGLHRQSRSKRA